jgi:hypothetical protein
MNPKEIETVEKLASQVFDAEQEESQTRKDRDAYKGEDPATKKKLNVDSVVAYAKAQNLRYALYDSIHGDKAKL